MRYRPAAGYSAGCCGAAAGKRRRSEPAAKQARAPAQVNPCFFDLSDRAKIRVGGGDRERFLNGQLTNDARKATKNRAIEACILNAKGKLDAHVFLRAEDQDFVLDAAAELRELLRARLERYVIADDVQMEELSDQVSLFHVAELTPPALPTGSTIVSSERFREPGYDVWVESGRHDELFRCLSERFAFCDADCAEVLRIEKGIPRWGRELTKEIIPVEAGLEAETIDYEKGCYIGQEVISRIKMSGQINKRLCGMVSLNARPLAVGMKLFGTAGEEKEVGWITSATHSLRLGEEIALGYVKRGFNLPAARLKGRGFGSKSGAEEIPLEVVSPPFAARP
jgi:tRNA-modifying protein YgfZ